MAPLALAQLDPASGRTMVPSTMPGQPARPVARTTAARRAVVLHAVQADVRPAAAPPAAPAAPAPARARPAAASASSQQAAQARVKTPIGTYSLGGRSEVVAALFGAAANVRDPFALGELIRAISAVAPPPPRRARPAAVQPVAVVEAPPAPPAPAMWEEEVEQPAAAVPLATATQGVIAADERLSAVLDSDAESEPPALQHLMHKADDVRPIAGRQPTMRAPVAAVWEEPLPVAPLRDGFGFGDWRGDLWEADSHPRIAAQAMAEAVTVPVPELEPYAPYVHEEPEVAAPEPLAWLPEEVQVEHESSPWEEPPVESRFWEEPQQQPHHQEEEQAASVPEPEAAAAAPVMVAAVEAVPEVAIPPPSAAASGASDLQNLLGAVMAAADAVMMSAAPVMAAAVPKAVLDVLPPAVAASVAAVAPPPPAAAPVTMAVSEPEAREGGVAMVSSAAPALPPLDDRMAALLEGAKADVAASPELRRLAFLLADELAAEVDRQLDTQTLATYQTLWEAFGGWWAEHGDGGSPLAARPELVALCLTSIYEEALRQGAGPEIIYQVSEAVAWAYARIGRPSPTEHSLCASVRNLAMRNLRGGSGAAARQQHQRSAGRH